MMAELKVATEYLQKFIRVVPDFPMKGILFRDIMPIFKEPNAVKIMTDLMATYIEETYPDVETIVGLDARGFLIGPMVAVKCSKSFVPIRKANKLPGDTYVIESVKEYGKDILEIQKDAIKHREKVIIIDDVLATGGTLQSSCQLIEQAKGDLLACITLAELEDLKGREKLSVPVYSILKY